MTTLTKQQQAAIKCAFVDLCASYQSWHDMDVYSHDWVAHRLSIDELMEQFPFLMQAKKDLNINLDDEDEDEEANGFELVPCKSGSCRQGVIETTYQELVAKFGEPNLEGDGGYKVSFEWSIQFNDGTYATIYDWKLEESERESVRNGRLYDFHIGGFNPSAVTEVRKAMGLSLV